MTYKNMTAGELLDISGKPLVMLGGEFTALRHVSKGIVTEYTWRNGEPVMILFKDSQVAKQGAFLIELKDAHNYANSDGHMSADLIKHAIAAAAAMGYDAHDKFAVRKIMDTILDGLADLIAMPPAPKELEKREQIGQGRNEMTLKLDGKTIFEALV